MNSDELLTAEELRITPIETGTGPHQGARVRKYIAALEAERDEALKQAQYGWERHAEKDRAYGEALAQRDNAVHVGKMFEQDARKHFEQSCANLKRAETAEQEKDAALADNAALLRRMRGAKAALTQHATFPADIMCAVDILTDTPGKTHHGAALLEEHRRALVRARNEGLERASRYLREVFDQPTMAGEIDALKEVES